MHPKMKCIRYVWILNIIMASIVYVWGPTFYIRTIARFCAIMLVIMYVGIDAYLNKIDPQ